MRFRNERMLGHIENSIWYPRGPNGLLWELSLFFEDFLMATTPAKHRHSAFISQNCRCYYCGFEMWETNPAQFAAKHNITTEQASRFQCTAEHLTARQDGGTNVKQNIVAACKHCNHTRHRMRPAPSPEVLRRAIAKQLANGSWHRKAAVTKLSSGIQRFTSA